MAPHKALGARMKLAKGSGAGTEEPANAHVCVCSMEAWSASMARRVHASCADGARPYGDLEREWRCAACTSVRGGGWAYPARKSRPAILSAGCDAGTTSRSLASSLPVYSLLAAKMEWGSSLGTAPCGRSRVRAAYVGRDLRRSRTRGPHFHKIPRNRAPDNVMGFMSENGGLDYYVSSIATVPVRLAVIVVWAGRPTCIDRRLGLGYDDRSPSTRASVPALVRLVVTDIHHLSTTARLLSFRHGDYGSAPALFYVACLGWEPLYRWEPHFWATASICTETMWGGIERSGFVKFPGLLAVPDK
ncbi:hypothetical protein B0H16DRAFT_1761683 [Mycena metata]|uniref:Uncharacterized protein n=1 Tax=Mycena metata TaxID=1033252 RepID=A0AAD7I9H8_9AGAR|nr:hypothetical protein B0H16DRAFT_1761683 [Mycena metata]